VDRIFSQFTQARSTTDVVATLGRAGVPASEVRSPNAAVRDPQVVARGETVRLRHPGSPDVAGRLRARVADHLLRFHGRVRSASARSGDTMKGFIAAFWAILRTAVVPGCRGDLIIPAIRGTMKVW